MALPTPDHARAGGGDTVQLPGPEAETSFWGLSGPGPLIPWDLWGAFSTWPPQCGWATSA